MTVACFCLVSTELQFAGWQLIMAFPITCNDVPSFPDAFLAPFPPAIQASGGPWAASEYCLLTLHSYLLYK